MNENVGDQIPASPVPELPPVPEAEPAVNFNPFLGAMDNAELPADIRAELEGIMYGTGERSYLHGRIHLLAEKGTIPGIIEMVLLSGLQASVGGDDIQYMRLSTTKRKQWLVEENMEPWNDCKEVCWGGMPADERAEYMDRMLRENRRALREDRVMQDRLGRLMSQGVGVRDAAKKYRHDPFLLATLAREIDRAYPGWQGLRQLLEVYPPVEGFGDPFQELRKYIDSWDRGLVPDDVGPQEWIEGQTHDHDQQYYFYFDKK